MACGAKTYPNFGKFPTVPWAFRLQTRPTFVNTVCGGIMAHKKVVRIDPLTLTLPAGGADSHAHLDGEEFDTDREAALERAKKCGLSHIGNVFLSPENYYARRQFFSDHPEVYFILGIHPCDGLKCTPACLDAIQEAFANDSRLAAVGEIGLDFHWNDCPRELQYQAFARQLEMAKKAGKPVVIHCREAEKECLALLEAGGFSGYPLLWHCFGGDAGLARRIIHNGWHISIPGTVTYPSNRALREAVVKIPEEKMLLETDSPYLSPVPWRGTRNEAAYTVFTARAIAAERAETPEEVWERCGQNACRFFGITDDSR